jgi:hypothetical protein
MDSPELHHRVEAFAQKLLNEAQGDPVRALGLLIVVLDGSAVSDPEQVTRLLWEVRNVLLPKKEDQSAAIIVQHLAGEMSWEGIQHCLRCGKVLRRSADSATVGFPSGYVYQINEAFTQDHCEVYEVCQ